MSNNILLPNKYKKIGWIILVPSFLIGLYLMITGYQPGFLNAKALTIFPDDFSGSKKFFAVMDVNLTNTIVGSSFIVGALLVGFTKEKNEDEFIANIRSSSLLWAVLANYILLLISFIWIYGSSFLSVMMYNMFTVMLIFIIRFNYILRKYSKSMADEK